MKTLYGIVAAILVLLLMYWVLSHSFLIVSVLPLFTVLALIFIALMIYVAIKRH